MEHEASHRHAGTCWLCWYCTSAFMTQTSRMRHMSSRHPRSNRLTPPRGFVELHHRAQRVASDVVAAPTPATYIAGVPDTPVVSFSPPGPTTVLSPTPAPVDAQEPRGDAEPGRPVVGGLGIVRAPIDGFARGTLAVPRLRNVFQTSTAARIRAYYEAMPEASRTRRLVPPEVGQRPSRFNTPLLREALKFSLCAGGPGLSKADQMWYVSVLIMAERRGVAQRRYDGLHGGRGGRKRPPPRAEDGAVGGAASFQFEDPGAGAVPEAEGSDDIQGDFGRAFPSKSAFTAAVREEQRRVLSKLRWDETPIEVEGVRYLFYSRDLLLVALDLLQSAGHVQLWGEELGVGSDASRVRSGMLDSDLFLTEELHVRRVHGSFSFVLAVQLFIDEAVVSWSGAHYVYPIRARVLNVRDRHVQWVTVGYVPHVGKPAARTATARRRASDARNGLLQRCLAVLLRRFVGSSRTGVPMEFPGRQPLTAVPRLVGIVADQLAERSIVCLMGNACEFFCSHCMVRRQVAGGPEGVGAPLRDVTAVLDAQLAGALTRDRDPRPSLRNQLRVEHSALAFVPAIGAVWGLATDSKQLYNIISFDLLHVWKLGVVRMVAQRFPSFLRVTCAGQDARLGPVPATLDALNLRAWEMGHLNVPGPTPPGYVGGPLGLGCTSVVIFPVFL